MYEVLDKFTIKFETLTHLPPTKCGYVFKGVVYEQRKDKIWAYAWGRYKSSLGMYCMRTASNHTTALRRGEFGGHHYLVYLLTC